MSSKSVYVHEQVTHNTYAASKILPFLKEILNPGSVIDVGCGTGSWLKIGKELGLAIKGVEGPHLDKNQLVIDADDVLIRNLEQPFEADARYDLVICLEVAEHLEQANAKQFAKSLSGLGDVILFSAAVPYQGGQNHKNEQWLSYWLPLFREQDFEPLDIIRPMYWDDERMEFWYKENIVLLMKPSHRDFNRLRDSFPSFHSKNLVHPDLYLKYTIALHNINHGKVGIGKLLKIAAKKVLKK